MGMSCLGDVSGKQRQKGTGMMNENVEKAKVFAEYGKTAVMSAYQKGNEMMDKVSFLKSSIHKKVAWGIIGAIVLAVLLRICGCGGSVAPFDVAQETMMALVAGDVETIFENMYVTDEIAKLPDSQKRLLSKQLIEGLISIYASMSDDEREVILEGLSRMKHVSTRIDGDTANVEASLKSVNGDESSQSFTLHKVDGEWKLDLNNR